MLATVAVGLVGCGTGSRNWNRGSRTSPCALPPYPHPRAEQRDLATINNFWGAAGIAPERVHFELFEAAQEQHDDTPFEIQITDGSIFTIPLGQSIIEVLEAHDVDVMYDCQRGDCGICRCDVIDGVPDHRDVVLSAAEREAGDVIQICVSRAKSARLVLDI